jgi:hypothetical protein
MSSKQFPSENDIHRTARASHSQTNNLEKSHRSSQKRPASSYYRHSKHHRHSSGGKHHARKERRSSDMILNGSPKNNQLKS